MVLRGRRKDMKHHISSNSEEVVLSLPKSNTS